MKKNLFALSALALATASSHAYTLLDNKDTGTKIDFTGSARFVWQSTSAKVNSNGNVTKEHINHAIANNGSRFGFKLQQSLGNDFYALGRVEWRFRGTARSQHNFDDIYTRQLYAGIGNKQYGELTYGHQVTITDGVYQTDLAHTLSLCSDLLITSARKVAQYTYSGIEGLKVGGFYGKGSKRGNTALDLTNKRKDVWGLAAIFNHKIDDNQSFTLSSGFTREASVNANNSSTSHNSVYAFGSAYTFDKTTIGLDLSHGHIENLGGIGTERKRNELTTVLSQQLTNDVRAYTMYAYKTDKIIPATSTDVKAVSHQFMLGAEYYIVPSYVKVFAEAATLRTKGYSNGEKVQKRRDNLVAIGLRASW